MNLDECIFYRLIFLAIYLPRLMGAQNENLIPIKTGLGEISLCSVGLQFFATLNNTSNEDYFVELVADECCISSDGALDYDTLQIIGETSDVIEKGNVKTFTLVGPLLDPYERIGHCVIHVDSRPVDKRSEIMRDTINIEFNTSLDGNNDIANRNIKKCPHVDEDPLNDCKPVDCDSYYNGNKPVFNEDTRKCIEIPKCRSKKSEDSVYDPKINTCMVLEPINKDDIDLIKSLNIDRSPEDVVIVESPDKALLNSPLYKFLLDLNNTDTMINNKIKTDIKKKFNFGSIIQYISSNKYTISVLGVVIFVQCCLICTLIYFFTKRSICKVGKKVEQKYFNYRQDASATTPLIATSNIDTETIFDYISESSNIEKKIKCYKSCQKERKTDPKISMSDDILTKCVNRRDWNTKPKSDIIKDADNAYFNSFNAEWKAVQSNIKETTILKSPKVKIDKGTEMEAENEKANEKQTYAINKVKEDYSDGDSSEKEINLHEYNIASMKIAKDNGKRTESMSSEKGAQACFSNDSVDDFLSERGMVFLAGERLSKYSLSTTTDTTDISSKTSKNRNMVKNVLSYLLRKTKKHTSSDPGVNKNRQGKDLELIHMSKASMYSSSASDYKNIKGIRGMGLGKDFRGTH